MNKPDSQYDSTKDDLEVHELLFGEGGPLDPSPPVLPMLKKWTGSPAFHLDKSAALTHPVQPTP